MNSTKSKSDKTSKGKKDKIKRKIFDMLQDGPCTISDSEESDDDINEENVVDINEESDDDMIEYIPNEAVQQASTKKSHNEKEDVNKHSEDTDDIIITSDEFNFIDPITKTDILNPVKNLLCNHIYEKSSILQHIKSAVLNGRTVRCPYFGCVMTHFYENHLVVDKEVSKKLKKKQATSKSTETDMNTDDCEQNKDKSANETTEQSLKMVGKRKQIEQVRACQSKIEKLKKKKICKKTVNSENALIDVDANNDGFEKQSDVIDISFEKDIEPTVTSLVSEIHSLKKITDKLMKDMDFMKKELDMIKNNGCGLNICGKKKSKSKKKNVHANDNIEMIHDMDDTFDAHEEIDKEDESIVIENNDVTKLQNENKENKENKVNKENNKHKENTEKKVNKEFKKLNDLPFILDLIARTHTEIENDLEERHKVTNNKNNEVMDIVEEFHVGNHPSTNSTELDDSGFMESVKNDDIAEKEFSQQLFFAPYTDLKRKLPKKARSARKRAKKV